ncbi:hypothetical protein ACFW2V_02330 [Streptomyces sp. NPDC058947]|uniref:hypothetical protein n=1 Tax=Streptomyces sp. NPDC058947 TaxID=3346675 RepID=UPI0036C33619
MDEGRDGTPPAGSGPPIAGELPPPQQAYGRYAQHFLGCWACRDVDRRCDKGEQLWREYEAAGAAAGRQMSDT